MHDAATPPAIWVRHGTLWRPFDRALVASRVHEYAGGLLEVGCASESIFALEHNTDSESLLLLIAALEIGVTIRLGTADTPLLPGSQRHRFVPRTSRHSPGSTLSVSPSPHAKTRVAASNA